MIVQTRITGVLFVIALMTGGAAIAADNGFYVGGSLGQGRPNFDTTGAFPGTATAVDNSSYAYKAFGGYQINRYFGAEVSHVSLGEYNISNGNKIDIKGWGVSLVGTLPLAKDVSLLGRIGEYRMRSAVNPVSTSDNTSTPSFGVGLKYDMNPNLSVRAEVERFLKMGSDTNTISSDANLYTIGVGYKF